MRPAFLRCWEGSLQEAASTTLREEKAEQSGKESEGDAAL